VQIDRDGARIGLRYPVACGLVGDAAPTLRALLPILEQNGDRRFLETAQRGMREWCQNLKEQGERRETPMKPQVVGYELNKLLDYGFRYQHLLVRALSRYPRRHEVCGVRKPSNDGMRAALRDGRGAGIS
jgi:hypothetical protein